MDVLAVIIAALIGSLPGVYAIYIQNRKNEEEKEYRAAQREAEQKAQMAEYKLELERTTWQQSQEIQIKQAAEISRLSERVTYLEEQVEKSERREKEFMRGIRILIAQIKESGLDPKWEPPKEW